LARASSVKCVPKRRQRPPEGAETVNVSAPQPRYRQLAQTLIAEIQAGKFPLGSLLPTENELCEQFGASRFTVREAVRQLVQMGMVSRRAGIGSRVEAQASAPGYRQVMSKFGDLHQYTEDTTLVIGHMATVEPPAAIAQSIRATAGQTWLFLSGLRHAGGGTPICVTHIYIHPTFRSLSVQPRQNVPIYTLIESQFGERVTHVQQDISAAPLDAANARLLEAKAGTPALHIVRRYRNSRDQTIEIALNLHPAGRFTYSEDFVHDWIAK